MKKIKTFLSYVAVAVAASFLTLMMVPESTTPALSKLDQLSAIIQNQFIGEADVTAMEDAAANAMVDALGDRWSYYIAAEDYEAHKAQVNNSYVGIGITITVREDTRGFDITQVTKGGPAEEAGILAGDILIGAAGEDLTGATSTEAANQIRGEEGTTVDLTVLREGQELSFTVERRTIQTIVATGRMLEGKVGLVTIENFNTNCAEESIAAIEDLLAQGAESLIFDVRNNPGGYKKELVKLLDYLLPEGDLFRSQWYDGREEVDRSDEAHLDIPMAVLVNSESYSAAEFFAAAIREYGAGFVAGSQTCGKGYFQVTLQLNDGSAVGLSVGKYFTPKGVSLADEGGLVPDVVVEVDDETFSAIYAGVLEPEQDPQIQAALEKLTK